MIIKSQKTTTLFQRCRGASFISALLACLTLATHAWAAPDGDLDTSFGTGGSREVPVNQVSAGDDEATGTVVQPDGKVLILGTAEDATGDRDCAVTRQEPNGDLDMSFGSGGTVFFSFGSSDLQDDCRAITVHLSSGKIVVVGSRGVAGGLDAAAVRLMPDGTLDGTFGTGGKVTVDLGSDEELKAVALHADGRIFAAGSYRYTSIDTDFLTLELSDTGTYTTHTTVWFDLSATEKHDGAEAILIQPDDHIVVAGVAMDDVGPRLAVARIEPIGVLDHTFGVHGKLETKLNGHHTHFAGLARQSDGKLLVAGTLLTGFLEVGAVRLDAAGNPDLSYGTNGVATYALGNSGDGIAHAVHLDGANRLVVVGTGDGDRTFAALRFDDLGQFDPSFGNQPWGFEMLYAPTGAAPAVAVDIGPSGEIYLVGWHVADSMDDLDFLIVLLQGSGGAPADQVC